MTGSPDMRPATGNSILPKIRINSYATIYADDTMGILRDINDPITNVVAATRPCQGNPARHVSDAE